jgi:hypothetical protein
LGDDVSLLWWRDKKERKSPKRRQFQSPWYSSPWSFSQHSLGDHRCHTAASPEISWTAGLVQLFRSISELVLIHFVRVPLEEGQRVARYELTVVHLARE